MRGPISFQWIEKKIEYTGPELRPHFILSSFQIEGHAMVAFRGPCQVKTDHLVDWEDRLAKDSIQAAEMIHFLGEFFQVPLPESVCLQRILVSICADVLNEKLKGSKVFRRGDDLFVEEKKLSVSIVAPSSASSVLHLGINIDPKGAPVLAVGLGELGIEPVEFAKEVLNRFSSEWASISRACVKVRPV